MNCEAKVLSSKEAKPLKLLHITGGSRYGGAARIILRLGQIAQAEGWQVDILTTDPVFQQAVKRHGLGLVNLDVIRREIRPLWDLGGLVRLGAFLRKEPYRIVHTHTSKAGFVGRLAARLAGVPVIVHTAHGFAFHEASPASIRLFYSILERIATRWCDRIVSVSEFHRRWAIELGMCNPGQIIAIPNGIAEFSPKRARAVAELRCQLGVSKGDLLILSMARLAADKGLEYLIEAAAMLPRSRQQIQVAIAGDGPARDRLEKLAIKLDVTDRVAFLGFREDVGDLLAACDLVVLPSLREGLSIALLEAMVAGKPIVATSIGSQREVASHAEMACLAPPADSLALSEAMLRLARDPALMARLGTNARAVYESCYTEDRMLDSYKRLYLDLLRTKCPEAAATQGRPSSIGGERRVVRQATANDLPAIVTIHQKAFSQFFLTRLGGEFLLKYYALVLNYRAGILLVTERNGALEGFACGFVDPAAFYRSMWDAKRIFTLPVLCALVRDPSLATKVLSGVQRIQTPASEWPERSCELSSIAVAPETSGAGLGKALMRAFLERARSMDAQCVYLTTDADGNDAVNAFYRDVGFQHTRRFLRRKGRWMNEYVIDGREVGARCEARP